MIFRVLINTIKLRYPQNNLKNAKELGATSLMFLIHPTLLEEEIQATCGAIKAVMNLAST